MKRFFNKLSIYAVYVVTLWTFILLFNLFAGSDKIDHQKKVVIFGDSHAKHGLNPKAISKNCINYSMSAEPLMFTYYKLKKIQNVIALDTVVLGIGPHSFSSFNDRKFTDNRWSNSMLSIGYRLFINEELTMPIDKKLLYKIIFQKMILLPHAYIYQEFLGNYSPIDPKNSILSKSNIDVTVNRHYYFNSEALKVSRLQLAYFNRINKFCNEEGIKLVIIAPPVHVDYLKELPAHFITSYDSIIHSYKDSMLVLDMLRVSVPDSFFYDGDHLNELGAKQVGDSIKQIFGRKPTNISADGF